MIYNYMGMSNKEHTAINFKSCIDSAVDKKLQQSQQDEDLEKLIAAILKKILHGGK